ncbi:MAG: hypothetical protein ACOX6V_05335 [Patescibacteria group bacterium]
MLQDAFPNLKHLFHVNLIVYNPTGTEFEASEKTQAHKFKRILEEFKINVSLRKNLGQEIHGACGQLRA